MIQELKPGFQITAKRTLPLYDRAKSRSLKVDPPEILPPLSLYSRVGPKFPDGAVFTPPVENDRVYDESLNKYRVWLLARMVGSSGKQPVPAFGGFVSATGMKPTRKSTIDYFTPINQPFTEYCVIQELLRQSEEATAEVGQKYILNTFDLGGCMKALPLIWKFPEKYKLHVVTPGQFHTVMNYMGMLTGHKFKGSGYDSSLMRRWRSSSMAAAIIFFAMFLSSSCCITSLAS